MLLFFNKTRVRYEEVLTLPFLSDIAIPIKIFFYKLFSIS